ncbi:hypothetical protein [Nocardia arthritidis]|nr:hypothetical protein [Nocardia arthritidis]
MRNRFGVDIDIFNSDLPDGAPEVVVPPHPANVTAYSSSSTDCSKP